MKKFFINFLFLSYSYINAMHIHPYMISIRFARNSWNGTEHLTKDWIDQEASAHGFNNPRDLLENILKNEKKAEEASMDYHLLLRKLSPYNQVFDYDQKLKVFYKRLSEAQNKLNNNNCAIKKKLL